MEGIRAHAHRDPGRSSCAEVPVARDMVTSPSSSLAAVTLCGARITDRHHGVHLRRSDYEGAMSAERPARAEHARYVTERLEAKNDPVRW